MPSILCGLGNPGRDYARTRHNLGFLVVDELARRWDLNWQRSRLRAQVARGRVAGVEAILAKPVTFMNESGQAVQRLTNWYKVGCESLLVICDDLDLPFGQLRLRARGSPGGHNGLLSLTHHLGSSDFARLRVGIGRPRHGEVRDYVLSGFSGAEREELPGIVSRGADAVEMYLRDGIVAAMNAFN